MEFPTRQPEVFWYVYVIAYAYALFVGLLVGRVTDLMYDLTRVERKSNFEWQPPILGIVERSLFLSSLIASYGGFIALWLTLKLTVQYKRWSGEDKTLQIKPGEEVLVGRTLFMNSLIGNGLSILYAGVGFGIIQWSHSGNTCFAVTIPAALVVGTVALGFWLWCHRRAKPKMKNLEPEMEK
jgi:hypothetical protein